MGRGAHFAILSALFASSAGVGCSGQDAAGKLKLPPAADASALGAGDRLSTVNDRSVTPNAPADVDVTGVVVVAKDDFDETGDGKSSGNLYVQDALDTAPAFGGIEIFGPSYSPPDLRVRPGDVIDVRGPYSEFAGPSSAPFPAGQTLPEISNGIVSFRYETPLPLPRKADRGRPPILEDLTSYDSGRKWLGVLVTLDDVTIAADGTKDAAGRYKAKLTTVSQSGSVYVTNALFALDTLPAGDGGASPLAANAHFASITGIVQYFFDFSIAPRSADDLKL